MNEKKRSFYDFLQIFQLFDLVKRENPKFRHKIITISGDCQSPGLGIDLNERALLIKHVNVVFHVAATVR
jgi:alcohol-forming fatty acyl-CoA reductase